MHAHQISPSGFIESKSITDVKKFDEDNASWFLFDLDNTLQEASDELGSDQWFRELCNIGATIKLEDGNAISLVIAIYHSVQKHVNTVVVEPEAVELIRSLQQSGRRVMGLTSRATCLEDTTYRQLESIGIDLKNNIIFCSGKDKGLCFVQYLQQRDEKPNHVIMAEDLEKHLVSLRVALTPLGIKFTGVRYGYLDEKVKQINMNKAHAQLLQLKPHLPDSTQRMIEVLGIKVDNAHQHPDYMGRFYFEGSSPKKQKPTVTQSMPLLRQSEHHEDMHQKKRFK